MIRKAEIDKIRDARGKLLDALAAAQKADDEDTITAKDLAVKACLAATDLLNYLDQRK